MRLGQHYLSLLPLCCWLITGPPTFAQTQLKPYRLAVVSDGSGGNLRPVFGYPGAAYLGNALEGGLILAEVSPNGEYWAGAREGSFFLARTPESGEAERLLELPPFEQAIWSADSRFFILVSENKSLLHFYRQQGTAEGEAKPWRLVQQERLGTSGTRFLALDGRREQLWFTRPAKNEADPSGLFVLDWRSAPAREIRVSGLAEAQSVALAQDGGEEWIVAAKKQVFSYRMSGDSWSQQEVYRLAENSELESVGVGRRGDGSWFSVWRGPAAHICWHDRGGDCREMSELDEQPTSLRLMASPRFYSLRSEFKNKEPLLLLDAESRHTYFVPWGDESK